MVLVALETCRETAVGLSAANSGPQEFEVTQTKRMHS